LHEVLDTLRFTAKDASRAIKDLGVVVRAGRGATSSTKNNPAIRILGWALTTIKQTKRAIVLLQDEEQLAAARVVPEHDEFEGLD
jgi:hypothetical protein